MDRVRLGRVLGRGARLAARTAYEALDAASSPGPVAAPQPRPAASARTITIEPPAVRRPAQPVEGRRMPAAAVRGSTGIFSPLRRASRAVTLEVTGSFFALFAASFALGSWRERGALHAGPHGWARLVVFCGVTLFFVYCSVSSFVRAKRVR